MKSVLHPKKISTARIISIEQHLEKRQITITVTYDNNRVISGTPFQLSQCEKLIQDLSREDVITLGAFLAIQQQDWMDTKIADLK